jgi:3-deoxy-manno-octulosonate cytidylyltransferase (CMP-KDO synthetase)
MKDLLAVIPARYPSSRFPGKPLVPILGVPMVVRVARLTAEAFGADATVVATDDERIATVVREAGFTAVLTGDCPTGTDRLAEVAEQLPARVYINVQGDEPMLDPSQLRRVADAMAAHPGCVVNGMAPLGPDEDPHNVNLPKVVANEAGRMVYMSRAAVPGWKAEHQRPAVFHKQVCIYGFERDHLLRYAAFGRKSTIEASEDIEILRFLELGVPVQMIPVDAGSLAVDVPDDVALVEERMRARGMA